MNRIIKIVIKILSFPVVCVWLIVGLIADFVWHKDSVINSMIDWLES